LIYNLWIRKQFRNIINFFPEILFCPEMASQEGGCKRFCDHRKKALVHKSMGKGRRGSNNASMFKEQHKCE